MGQKLIVVGTLMGIQAYFLAHYDRAARQGLWFLPPQGPGTPAASLQRRLPCCDELLTGPKTLSLMPCQAIHGPTGMLAASWPAPYITGLNPFYPSASLPPSFSPPFLTGASELLCKALQAEMGEFF